MSNLIKASQIAYSEEIRTIDMNKRADEFQQLFMDKYINDTVKPDFDMEEVSKKLESEKVITPEDVDFVPGLATEQVYISDEESLVGGEGSAMDIETRLLEKRKELEMITKQIEDAQKEAEHIINEANEQAKGILESAMNEAESQKNSVFEEAQNMGYEAGQAQMESEIESARLQYEKALRQYKEDYEKQVDALEPAFVEIVLKYVEKLTGIYAEDKRDIILYLIDNAMKDKKNIENFIIRVSEADFAMASYSKDSVRAYISEEASLEVVADKMLAKNQCLIETESRIFDCSLDGQLMNLIEDIRLLAEKE